MHCYGVSHQLAKQYCVCHSREYDDDHLSAYQERRFNQAVIDDFIGLPFETWDEAQYPFVQAWVRLDFTNAWTLSNHRNHCFRWWSH
jgi:hypothetical protein